MLLDTHTLLWYTLAPDKLSEKAARALARADRAKIYVSSISFWEIAIKLQRKQIDLGISLGEYRTGVNHSGIQTVAVDAEQWIASVALQWAHRDPVDRILVALARRERWKLITKDSAIQDFHPGCLW